jgi:hypothetical protein
MKGWICIIEMGKFEIHALLKCTVTVESNVLKRLRIFVFEICNLNTESTELLI